LDTPDLSYTAVIDNNIINLTPLGKFVMPPPMSEKQVPLPFSEEPPSCFTMHGHTALALAPSSSSEGSLLVFDCLGFDPKCAAGQILALGGDLGKVVNLREVYKLLAFKGRREKEGTSSELTVVMVEN
jgi:hypothetical protein